MMDNKYFKLNNITGWMIWLIATVVYVATIEPSASFWDCGEFISAAYKLQIGHPPGAPLWLMISRVFALFSADVEGVAAMVNVFSALCSSFSILFLFWSVTAIAKKLAVQSGPLDTAKTITILSSGAIGALVYTFSDSFWFSAVEAEVYAASSVFTAAVFWLILKWESLADEPFADRYLLLIAYLMGLSIGVHILNLLAIPAIVYVYYFKRFNYSFKGMVYAGLASVVLLGVVQKGIISYSVKLAAKFDIFFTNSLGLPFDTGMWIYFILILVLIFFGIKNTALKRKANLHNAVVSLLLILLGYSSFAMIVIRSKANPPMDENNPDNIVSLLPYLNREQYGDSPLLYGYTFDSELDAEKPYLDGSPVYYRAANGKYEIADDRKMSIPNYDKKTQMLFPRMFSSQKHHVDAYKAWVTKFRGKQVRVKTRGQGGNPTFEMRTIPTMGENLEFFFKYQINFSYWRYFMWNFVGRQNDIQGHGVAGGSDMVLKGNWLSGIPFVDNAHLGNQETLPASLKDNPGRNTFYFLPLILGLIGLVYHVAKNWKSAFVVALLFFMTGIAIILYLNPTPYQPRERDYAYACSFYAFAIWIGLGVQAIFQYMFNERISKKEVEIEEESFLQKIGKYEIGFTILLLFLIGIVGYVADNLVVAYSLFFIAGLMALTIVFTYLIGNLNLSTNLKAIIALLLTLPIPYVMAVDGWDDHDRSNKYTARDFAKNYLDSCEENAIIFTNGDNDTFPLWYVQDVEGYRTDVRVVNLSLLNTDWYIEQMMRKAYDSEAVPFSFTEDQYRQGGSRDFVFMNARKDTLPLSMAMEYVKSDNPSYQVPLANGKRASRLPGNKFFVPVPASVLEDSSLVLPHLKDYVEKELVIAFSDRKSTLMKAQLMILDLINNNNWERPIYFAITVGKEHYMNLEDYFQLEGLAYRLTPINQSQLKPAQARQENGGIHLDKMYHNFMVKYAWGNIEVPGVYVEEQSQRMCLNFRSNFARLANEFILQRNDKQSAINLLDRAQEVMPREKIPYNDFMLYIVDAYYRADAFEKGDKIAYELLEQLKEQMDWYMDQTEFVELLTENIFRNKGAIDFLSRLGKAYNRTELSEEILKVEAGYSASLNRMRM